MSINLHLHQIVHNGGVTALKFIDDRYVLSSSTDRTCALWDLESEKPDDEQLIPDVVYSGHERQVRDIALDRKNLEFYSVSMDETVKKWHFYDPKCLLSWNAHDKQIMSVDFYNDIVLTGSWDAHVGIWNSNGELIKKVIAHSGYVRPVALSPDGKHFVSGGKDSVARVWSIDGEQIVGHRFNSWVDAVCWSRDGSSIFIGLRRGEILRWDWKDGANVVSEAFKYHNSRIHSIDIHPSEKYLLLSSRDSRASILSNDMELLSYVRGHKNWVLRANFSRDGKYFATGSYDHSGRVWQLSDFLENPDLTPPPIISHA